MSAMRFDVVFHNNRKKRATFDLTESMRENLSRIRQEEHDDLEFFINHKKVNIDDLIFLESPIHVAPKIIRFLSENEDLRNRGIMDKPSDDSFLINDCGISRVRSQYVIVFGMILFIGKRKPNKADVRWVKIQTYGRFLFMSGKLNLVPHIPDVLWIKEPRGAPYDFTTMKGMFCRIIGSWSKNWIPSVYHIICENGYVFNLYKNEVDLPE